MIEYIVKSSLSLIMFFGLYWFLLRKEKLFVFNRFFLIFSVVFSLAVPFISIPVNLQPASGTAGFVPAYSQIIPGINTAYDIIPENEEISQPYSAKQHSEINFSAILLAFYFSGVILLLFRFLRNIYVIILKTKISEKTSFKGYRIVLTDEKTDPCCFLSSIYLNRDDYLTGRFDQELLEHELEHAKQSHTIDIILIELVKIFYWFNPVPFLYERAIRINHEYLADNVVITEKSDIKSYADILLGYITSAGKMSLTSGSNHSFTKMRLKMMMKSGSGRFIYVTRIAVTLFLGILVFIFLSFKETGNQPSEQNLSGTGTEITQNVVRGIVTMDDGKPLFGATIKTTLTNNKSIETISDFDGRFSVENVQSGASLLIEYRGFKPKTLKADFSSDLVVKLVRDPQFKDYIVINLEQTVNFRNPDFSRANALVVIDGRVSDYKDNLKVRPDEMRSFKVLKDIDAVKKYGEKGKNGVIEITTYGNKIRSDVTRDSSKYKTILRINRFLNKGESIDIPIPSLVYISVWTHQYLDKTDKKELRSISIMTRDYFKVKGRVVRENGKPLPGVKVSATGNPVTETTDKNGLFVIKDVMEGVLLEFSLPKYNTYYLSTSFGVPFNTELTVELVKANAREKDDINESTEKIP